MKNKVCCWVIHPSRAQKESSGGVVAREAEGFYDAENLTHGHVADYSGLQIDYSGKTPELKNIGKVPLILTSIDSYAEPQLLEPGETEEITQAAMRVSAKVEEDDDDDESKKKVSVKRYNLRPKRKKIDIIFKEESTLEEEEEEKERRVGGIHKGESYIIYKEVTYIMSNYLFYTNKIPCRPIGLCISEFHRKWRGDYYQLELSHDFIQWLFPIFEASHFNGLSVPLTRTEARLIRNDLQAAKNFVESYKLMLDFYGLRLLDERTGRVGYVKDHTLLMSRMRNLNERPHNNLRITRILKSLGHLGFTRYKRPLLTALTRAVNRFVPRARPSLVSFWEPTVKYDSPRYFDFTKEVPEDREPSVFFSTFLTN